MTGRFMTPDVQEMVTFASSAMSPGDVEAFLKKTLPVAPSATAIRRCCCCGGHATSHQSFAQVVVLCDGKETIWKAAEKCTEVKDATFILDLYHASQSLAGAANAIFGEGTDKTREWHEKHRDRLQLDPDALPKLLRALNRHLDKLAAGSKAHDVVRRAIAHFRTNPRRMKYPEFIAAGLPIGGGHIESAAKFLVTQRMKRSGMRWSWLGGQRILDIRARVKEGRWDAAWGAYLHARAAA